MNISRSAAPLAVRVVVIVPVFNHGGTVGSVLANLAAASYDVIAVNDGSTDFTATVLQAWRADGCPPQRDVVTLTHNRGKAAALRAGFVRAIELGFTHALTMDSDGQHEVGDVASLAEAITATPGALVIGERRDGKGDAPIASRLGRTLSNWLVWCESGVRVGDSQTGMRAYPLDRMQELTGVASRYAFETEVLVRAGWHGIPVVERPICCVYEVPGGRTTHFRIWRDTLGAIWMHVGLIARALTLGPTREHISQDSDTGTLLRRLGRWFSPRRLLRMATGDAPSRERFAASIGVGFLMATLPIYGIKGVTSLWLAGRFRLHPLAVITISSLSTPPLGLIFVAISFCVGSLLTHGQLPDLSTIDLRHVACWSTLNDLLTEWLLGSVISGAALGGTAYGLTRLVLMRPRFQPQTLPDHPGTEQA